MTIAAISSLAREFYVVVGVSILPILAACGGDGKAQGRGDGGDADAGPSDAAIVEGGTDAGASFFADGPIHGWVGGACTVNNDCTASPAAMESGKYGCINEVFCLDGVCHGDCTITCSMVRTDINPCPAPRICTALPGSGPTTVCKITPIPCTTAATCPRYLPSFPDGGTGEWSCTDGICRYPGFSYSTE